jgi:hypothetical protein
MICHGIVELALIDHPSQEVSDTFLRCALFHAARHGCQGAILNPITGQMTSQDIAIQSVLMALEAVSSDFESKRVEAFLSARSSHGGFDSSQREAAKRAGQLSGVIDWARSQFLSDRGP